MKDSEWELVNGAEIDQDRIEQNMFLCRSAAMPALVCYLPMSFVLGQLFALRFAPSSDDIPLC